MILQLDSKVNRKVARGISIAALSLLITITGFSAAFGDFLPSTTAKVLGVGRIQSAALETPVAAVAKFETAQESKATHVAELSAPIAREAAEIVAPEPEPVVTPEPDPTPA
ncbi:MAG TPA: hypothetical protein DEB24_07880, partial [Coriobacteriia bacterium]|nr:hypothetical protein [Coriobacteriia bacterium]